MFASPRSRTPLLSAIAISILATFAHFAYSPPTLAGSQADLAWPYDVWLNQDVAYIITPQERAAFLELTTDEDRDNFIEQFWLRRNPDPKSLENEFEIEHYRRIAFANQNFASAKPGWQTDRGHVYIVFGKPDDVVCRRSARAFGSPDEFWGYKYLEGWGNNATLQFSALQGDGEYKLVLDDAQRKQLLEPQSHVATHEPPPFVRTEQYARGVMAPLLRFKDLSAVVSARIVRSQLAFEHSYAVERLTDCTAIVNIKLDIPETQLRLDDNAKAKVQIFGRVVNPANRIQATFEEEVSSNSDSNGDLSAAAPVLSLTKSVPLFYGTYTLTIAIKDPVTGEIGIETIPLSLPRRDQN